MIYFGWPRAHEDDAQRALHSGLGIVQAITTTLNPRLARQKGVKLTVRLGIHTGPVVVGAMGDGERQENLATGETVNIAARLEGLAAPNTVVISATVARLVDKAFNLQVLGPQVLKGIAEPMAVFRVLDTMAEEADENPFFPGVPLLVGRDEEVKLLVRCWEQSQEGRGQAVMISSEAGIGKSSLLEIMRAQVREAELPWIAFRCSPYHHNSALYPVITHLERLLRFARHDSPQVKLTKLETGLRTRNLPPQEVVPLFAALLSVPLPEGHYAALNVPCLQWIIDTLSDELAQEYFGQGVPPAVHAYAFLAQNHAELGTFAAGIACGESGIRIAEAVARPLVVMSAYRGMGLLYLHQGDLPRALPVLERAVGICQDLHMPLYFVTVAPTLGAAYTLSGRLDEAVSLLTQAVEQSVTIGAMMAQSLRVAFLGEAHLQAGRLEEANTCAQQALALAHTHAERGHRAYIQRLFGDLARHHDPPATDQAADHYRQALALAEELGMRPLQAHCHRSLGLFYAHIEEAEPARSELSTAVEMYRDMAMPFWLPETEAALDEVAKQR